MVGFRLVVMKFLKAERFQLKTRYLKDKDKAPPLHVDDDEWERLKDYWNTESLKKKAKSMAVARQSVKPSTLVRRKGKAAKEAPLTGGSQSASALSDISQARLAKANVGGAGNAAGESVHWEALETFHADVDAKFNEVSAIVKATNKAVEELRSMMVQFMHKDKKFCNAVTATSEELTLSDSEHAILHSHTPSPEFQVVQCVDMPRSEAARDPDRHVAYDLDGAWVSGPTAESKGTEVDPTADAVLPNAGSEDKAGGQEDPVPT